MKKMHWMNHRVSEKTQARLQAAVIVMVLVGIVVSYAWLVERRVVPSPNAPLREVLSGRNEASWVAVSAAMPLPTAPPGDAAEPSQTAVQVPSVETGVIESPATSTGLRSTNVTVSLQVAYEWATVWQLEAAGEGRVVALCRYGTNRVEVWDITPEGGGLAPRLRREPLEQGSLLRLNGQGTEMSAVTARLAELVGSQGRVDVYFMPGAAIAEAIRRETERAEAHAKARGLQRIELRGRLDAEVPGRFLIAAAQDHGQAGVAAVSSLAARAAGMRASAEPMDLAGTPRQASSAKK